MNALNVIVPVQNIRLLSVSKPLHQFLCERNNLPIRHIILLCRVDGGVERHLFAAETAALIDGEGLHGFSWIGNV